MKRDVAVARNYALAFLNSFLDELSIDDFLKIRNVLSFWEEQKKILHFLDLPGFDNTKKCDLIEEILTQLSAPPPLKELMFLLVRHKRVAYIRDVLKKTCALYKQRKNVEFFSVSSAHELLADEVQSIKNFLEKKSGKQVLCDCTVDKNLIAGIRCQSESLMWEHSVRKQLDDLRRQLISRGAT